MLEKLNKIKTWQAALIITLLGFASHFTGLNTPFQGDDLAQIVNNIPVHSIANIKLFFEGSTFYNGQGLAPLSGYYYRPLMSTTFSLIYTLFGPHQLYFHVIQILLCIGCSFVLYLFFRYSFEPVIAMLLALIFLVHPINSQNAYAIPNLQDPLFFFFGIVSLWLLVRYRSAWSLILVALCLLLSLLAKESAIDFIAMALLYLIWFNRERLLAFVGIMVIPLAIYLTLKTEAVGLFFVNPNTGPIDRLSLMVRLLNIPSIVLFYLTKFIFPWKLATAYYWAYTRFSVRHVLGPLIIDMLVAAFIVYGDRMVRQRNTKAMYYTYLYFIAWFAVGLLLYLQITPLDFTTNEAWFYFSSAGALGMIGVVLSTYRIRTQWLLIAGVSVVLILGIRTVYRGRDYRNQYVLAYADSAASKEDFYADETITYVMVNAGQFAQAKTYAMNAVRIFPSYGPYNSLGNVLSNEGAYSGAVAAYTKGLQYGHDDVLNEDLGELTLVYGNPTANKQYLENAVRQFPGDSRLWMYLALYQQRYNDNADAKISITKAAMYGSVPQFIYNGIMNNDRLLISLGASGKTVVIP